MPAIPIVLLLLGTGAVVGSSATFVLSDTVKNAVLLSGIAYVGFKVATR